ncbi:MAG TPA: hypothetical protein VFY23_06420 [Candidatus Limnocylindrales bacterium]|nr:hypothetical protein [Candidatus Limnocylindrales bacterium]
MRRASAIIIALALVAAACADTGPTVGPNGPDGTPATSVEPGQSAEAVATPPPTPAPTPTPVPASELAAATLADTTFKATADITARTTLGSTKSTTTAKVDIDGRTTHMVRTIKTGKNAAKVETITGNGTRYLKQKGVWTKAGDADNTELIAILRAIPSMTDLGVEDKDGAQLHHLQATTVPGVPRELELAGKGVSDVSNTLDLWVTDDGTPVSATLVTTWKQKIDKKTVDGKRTAQIVFSDVGGDVTVTVPTDIWAFFNSTRNDYRMGHPADWTAKKGNARTMDSFNGGDLYAYAGRARASNVTLKFITGKILGELRSITDYTSLKITSNRSYRLDGVPARRIEFRGITGGSKVYGQAVYAIKGGFWYFVGFDEFEKTSKATRDLFTRMLKTFDFR